MGAFHRTLPARALLTKAADRRLEINSMEPTDESEGKKESGERQRSSTEDFNRRENGKK